MKFIKQFLLILFLSFLGELLKMVIPLPIPATVWGMVLMFAALSMGLIKLEQVEDTADFLLEIMPILFIPFGVSLIANYDQLAEHASAILLITLISFVICYGVTGKTADFIIEHTKHHKEAHYE
ncbi:MAG: CidA/LrgA family protein [Firmicutes bacterium]|jgi:holin-like protein|nr:CidA/LrgA family protein [Bacillota bacterium]